MKNIIVFCYRLKEESPVYKLKVITDFSSESHKFVLVSTKNKEKKTVHLLSNDVCY